MTITGYKRLVIGLSVALLLVLALAAKLFWDTGMLQVQVAFASEQTGIFDSMRTQALSSDAAGAAGSLEYVVHYYPSGTKQVAGSRLDGVVMHIGSMLRLSIRCSERGLRRVADLLRWTESQITLP
jgi:hypothetical protein